MRRPAADFELSSERLYPVKIAISLQEAKRNWLEVLFIDEASRSESKLPSQLTLDTLTGPSLPLQLGSHASLQ